MLVEQQEDGSQFSLRDRGRKCKALQSQEEQHGLTRSAWEEATAGNYASPRGTEEGAPSVVLFHFILHSAFARNRFEGIS